MRYDVPQKWAVDKERTERIEEATGRILYR